MKASLERIAGERADARRAALDQQVLATFERSSRKRNGVAVAEARDGICTICHVRLRPQVFNTVLRNEEILQCDQLQPHPVLRAVPASAADAPASTDVGARTRRCRSTTRDRPSSPISTAARAATPARPASASASRSRTARSSKNSRESIGVATNNVAEYRGLLAALEWAQAHGCRRAARPLRFAAARAADARQLQSEERRPAAAAREGAAARARDRPRHLRARRPRAERARRPPRQCRDGRSGASRMTLARASRHSSLHARRPDGGRHPSRRPLPSRRYEQNSSGWLAVHRLARVYLPAGTPAASS